MEWQIIVMPAAEKHLSAITDRRIRQSLTDIIESLETDPEKKGKALVGNLKGCRSIRTPGQRYRIIYRVNTQQRAVNILALGIRKEGDKADIYALAKKLVRAGLFALLLLFITTGIF